MLVLGLSLVPRLDASWLQQPLDMKSWGCIEPHDTLAVDRGFTPKSKMR